MIIPFGHCELDERTLPMRQTAKRMSSSPATTWSGICAFSRPVSLLPAGANTDHGYALEQKEMRPPGG